jgi:serine O-acetyltransferase
MKIQPASDTTKRSNDGNPLDEFAAQIAKTLVDDQRPRLAKAKVDAWIRTMLDTLFPQISEQAHVTSDIRITLSDLDRDLRLLVASVRPASGPNATKVSVAFFESLPDLRHQMVADAVAIERGDPAAESVDEVILAYPGFLAMAVYRIAHRLCELRVPILPRVLSEWAHGQTGVDIHPGAIIGHPVVIDHGTGIVIGETAIIGNNVKLYQGVTLGALSVDKSLASTKRHPTIEDDVVVYANATILGGETVIGRGSIIGGNTWVTSSIPPNSTVYQRSEVHVHHGRDDFEPPDFVI